MKPIYTILCAVLLMIASQVSGQNMSTSFNTVPSPGPASYPVGTKVTINMNVTNFTNISSVLMPVTYNANVLRFDSIDNPVIPEYIDTTVVPFHPTAGVIKIVWFPSLINYPNGVTVPGTNARLLTLQFTVIADGVTDVNLSTTVPNTPIEVINATGDQVYSNAIFTSSGSVNNGVTITGGDGIIVPPLVGFKIIGTDVYAKQGHRVCVPVTVNDFDNMQLLQYAMHWDNTVLTYDCVRGTANPIVPTFNPPAAAPGTLLLQWEDPNLLSGIGVTKPDGTRIYEVCFNAIGAPGSQSNITFDGFGFGFPPDFTNDFAEAANASGNNVWEKSGPNGPSGVNSKVYIMSEPPGGTPVTYSIVSDTIAPNILGCVDIKVKNFVSITESEFLINYDATKLSYTTPVTIPATTLNVLPINITHAVSAGVGAIKFKWALAAGATVADNTTIFSPCFTPVGMDGTVVPLTFGTSACPNPTPYATHKKNSGGQRFKMEDGTVLIKSSNGPPTATATNALCPIGATGSLASTPNGTATAYIWNTPNNATTQNVSNVPAGTYTVTVTYASGTTATASATVGTPTPISMTQVATAVKCFGESNGALDITPAGGKSPYTYQWAGPMGFSATTQDITGVITGNYVVSITDANGCVFASPAVNISQPQAISTPSNGTTVTNVTCFGASNGAISITPQGGTAPYTYDWSYDGAEFPDNDPQNPTGLSAMNHTVTITDANGCTFSPSAMTVSEPQVLAANFAQKQDVACFGSATGSATINVTGGTGNKTYSWKTVPGGAQVSTTNPATNLAAGTYTCIVTDMNGCTGALANNVTIDNPGSALMVSNTTTDGTCFGAPTGSIDLTVTGGWGGFTYAWPAPLPAIPDHTGVSSGTYTVTVTDAKLCTSTNTVIVGGPQTAIAIGTPMVTPVTCFGQGNGGICLNLTGGAGAPYTVAWSGTTLTGACIGTLPGGNYAPTVTDGQGCTNVFNPISLPEPTELILTATTMQANPTGGIDLTVLGGSPNYTYSWMGANGPVNTTEDLTGMPAGTYTVLVTDANGCSKSGTYEIVSANVVLGTTATATPSCNNDGCINVVIPTGASSASPFTLSWSGGTLPASASLTPAICGLNAGSYIVTVTASNGNTATASATVDQKQQALLGLQNTNNPTGAQMDGSISLTSAFPSVPFTYIWNTGATTNNLMMLDSGTYTVTVTNENSMCTAIYSYTLIRSYVAIQTFSDMVQPSCVNIPDGSINIFITGGNPPYNYLWSGPGGYSATTKNITGLAPGSYTLTVTDQNSTTMVSGPFALTAQSGLAISNVNETSITPGGTQVSGEGICDGVASVVFGNGVGNTSILWSNGVTTATNSTMCGGDYAVTVTDAAGCTSVWADALTVPAAIAMTNTTLSPTCAGDVNGSAKVFVTGGIEPYEVFWSNGQSDQLVFSNTFSEAVSLAGGTYTVTIYDANDVAKEFTVNVPQPQPIEVSFTGVDPFNFNTCDGERIAFITGAVAPISYTWAGSFGHTGNTERAEGLCAGEILYYEIVDAFGCSASVVDTVPYPEDGCWHVRPVLTPAEQDGNNDYTFITCAESAPNTVEIYNRWGQLVFQTEGYSNNPSDPSHTWTGFTRSGQALPEGVYYYVLTYIDEEDNQHQLKGHINLLK